MAIQNDRITRRNRRAKCRGISFPMLGLVVSMGTFAACDGLDRLLTVDIPGSVVEADLGDPALATALVLGAQAEFECALRSHIVNVDGIWAGAVHLNYAGATRIFLEA